MDIDIPNRYPRQDWWDWMSNTRFRYEDWHKYTCEWDTASVTIYLDDVLINKFWKYYRDVSVAVYDPYRDDEVYAQVKQPLTCIAEAGEWQITKGYPWNSENSLSKLIFSVASTKKDKIHNTSSRVDLGQMEIDYVSVYQRHPEEEEHREIYADTVRIGSSSEMIRIDPVPERLFTSRNTNLATGKQNFNLWVTTNMPGASYHWRIWYGISGPEHYYEASGQYVTSPVIDQSAQDAYYLRWEVEVVTPEGSKTIAGSNDDFSGTVPVLSDASSFMTADSMTFHLETRFNTEEDWGRYQQNVAQVLKNTFVTHTEDTFAINQLVNRVRIQCLEPYLYFEEKEQAKFQRHIFCLNQFSVYLLEQNKK